MANEKRQSSHALESMLHNILEDVVHFNNVLFTVCKSQVSAYLSDVLAIMGNWTIFSFVLDSIILKLIVLILIKLNN